MPSASRVLALGALLVGTGCAAYTPFLCPAKGGAPWREVTTPSFSVRTDLSSGDAREVALELERLNAVVVGSLFRRPPPVTARLTVVVFRNRTEFQSFARDPEMLAFFKIDGRGDEVIVMYGSLGFEARTIIAHELTHRILARAFARQPIWFAEGMATFMESVGKESWQTSPTLGGIPLRIDRGEAYTRLPVGAVLTATTLEARGYATAWALVHYLHNHRAAEFGALQQRFARGDEPEIAWRETFPAWDPRDPGAVKALDHELAVYLSGGKYGYRPLDIPPTHVVPTELPLVPADAHGVRLALRDFKRGKPNPAVDAELDEALAEEPDNVAVLEAAARRWPDRALELARRATQAHPKDARAWRLLAYHLPEADAAGRDDALRRSLAQEPDHPGALILLAAQLVDEERHGEALPLARRAVELVPWNPIAQATLGGSLAGLGQCAEATRALRRALDGMSEGRDGICPAAEAELARLRTVCPEAK